ncbi:phage holin family protein [Chitinibacteraceae bacterium HSL-7]
MSERKHPLNRLAASLIGLVHAHLGVFSVELEEARDRLTSLLVVALLGVGMLIICLVLFAWALVLSIPPESRVMALLIAGAVLLLAGGGCVYAAWRGARHGPRPFAVTLEELQRDRERLL